MALHAYLHNENYGNDKAETTKYKLYVERPDGSLLIDGEQTDLDLEVTDEQYHAFRAALDERLGEEVEWF